MDHACEQGDKMNMEVDMDDTDTANNFNYGYNSYDHPAEAATNGHHQPQQQALPPPHPQHGTSHYNNSHFKTERDASIPARSDSQRSQTRRFAAGHAEMQPSAFLSAQEDHEEEWQKSSHKSKSSPLEAAAANGNAMDSSMSAYYDTQRQKRPRRYTKDPKDEQQR